MNKTILPICMLAMSIAANAQFKIHSNGKLSFNTTAAPLSPVSLNSAGDSTFFMAYSGRQSAFTYHIEGNDVGSQISLCPRKNLSLSRVLTIRSESPVFPIINHCSFGIHSTAKGSMSNYALCGYLPLMNKGAGILGIYGNVTNQQLGLTSGYAGYFFGDVNVSGTFSADLMLGESASSSNSGMEVLPTNGADTRSSIALKFQQLQAQAYYNTESEDAAKGETASDEFKELFGESSDKDSAKGVLEEQRMKKLHYALNAEQLETVFPELVYELEDGTKRINYIEMIPLLIECINGLSSKVSGNNSADSESQKARQNATSDIQKLATSARLLQNTPNPFTERTEIRFSVPDDARSAYLYIFDMTGKMLRQIPVDSSMQSVTINGYELSAGIYLYSLVINGQEIDTKRMILSK